MAALVVFKWLFILLWTKLAVFFVIFVVNLKKFENIKWWILFVVSWNRNRNCHFSDKKQIFKLLGTSDSSVQTKKMNGWWICFLSQGFLARNLAHINVKDLIFAWIPSNTVQKFTMRSFLFIKVLITSKQVKMWFSVIKELFYNPLRLMTLQPVLVGCCVAKKILATLFCSRKSGDDGLYFTDLSKNTNS